MFDHLKHGEVLGRRMVTSHEQCDGDDNSYLQHTIHQISLAQRTKFLNELNHVITESGPIEPIDVLIDRVTLRMFVDFDFLEHLSAERTQTCRDVDRTVDTARETVRGEERFITVAAGVDDRRWHEHVGPEFDQKERAVRIVLEQILEAVATREFIEDLIDGYRFERVRVLHLNVVGMQTEQIVLVGTVRFRRWIDERRMGRTRCAFDFDERVQFVETEVVVADAGQRKTRGIGHHDPL